MFFNVFFKISYKKINPIFSKNFLRFAININVYWGFERKKLKSNFLRFVVTI